MTPYQEKQNALFDDIEKRFQEGKAPSLIVEMREDFEEDPARALTNVAFVPELRAHPVYQALEQELQQVSPEQYFYPTSSLHTTIKNVRVVNDPPRFTTDDIERIRPVLRAVASRHAPFEINWNGLLELPTSLALRGLSSEACTRLVLDLHQSLEKAGVPDDKFYASMDLFASTITVCRYTHTPSIAFKEVIQTYKHAFFGTHVFDQFSLVVCNSVLTQRASTVIETFPLNA